MTLNSDLLDLPKELGEFVIVHELVHLLVHNHGRVFKSFMYAYMPDWETRTVQDGEGNQCNSVILHREHSYCLAHNPLPWFLKQRKIQAEATPTERSVRM